MSFRTELATMPPRILGLTESGQGKATGAYTVFPCLGDGTKILYPSNGNLLTRTIWSYADALYTQGRTRPGNDGKNAIPEWKIWLANRELVTALENSDAHFISMHGLFGYGAKRDVIEIDTYVEPTIAGLRTRAFVPLHQTAFQLQQIGREKGIKKQEIEVVGFLVPDVLKDLQSKERRTKTLSQKAPTVDRPLRLALMTTGQFLHQDVFTKQILADEVIHRGIRDKTIGFDIYMWNNPLQAQHIAQVSKNLGYDTVVSQQYDPDSPASVQVFYNSETQTAVEGSMAMAARADIAVSVLAERVGWALEVPFISLDPGNNPKMRSNTVWAEKNGLAVPFKEGQRFGELMKSFFGDGENSITQHAEHAVRTKEESGVSRLSDGAHNIKNIISAI